MYKWWEKNIDVKNGDMKTSISWLVLLSHILYDHENWTISGGTTAIKKNIRHNKIFLPETNIKTTPKYFFKKKHSIFFQVTMSYCQVDIQTGNIPTASEKQKLIDNNEIVSDIGNTFLWIIFVK